MYKIKVRVVNGKDGKVWHEADSLEEAYSSINYLVPCAFLEDAITITVSSCTERKVEE